MANTDSLSHDQLDKVMQFQEVSGCTDVCVCVAALTAANWEVETAVHEHLTKTSDSSNGNKDTTESSSSSGVRQRVVGTSNSTSQDIQPSIPRVIGVRSGENPGALHRLWNFAVYIGFYIPSRVLVRWPLRFAFWSFSSLLNFVHSLLYSTSTTDPTADMQKFISTYEATYSGLPRPPMFPGTYNQALSSAKQNLRFLLVYLHCSDNLRTDTFCRNVLASSRFINYISDNNIIFWACDVTLTEGFRVSQALRENDYPYLALMVLRNNRMSVVARMEGAALLDVDHVLQSLTRHHDSSMHFVNAARLSRLQREQANALREEQDSAYQASLKADREKARKKMEEEEQEKERLRELERKEELEKSRRERLKQMIPEEPPADSPGALPLVVKLPHGERLERRFHVDQPLSALFCLIYTNEEAPDRFEVTTNFPRKTIPCLPPPEESDSDFSCDGPKTFGECGIAPRTVLFVKDLDA